MVVNTSPSRRTRFLWWLSTADEQLLTDCTVDRGRYAIIGMLVLGTWTFATLAWAYFFSTVVASVYAAILLGLLMGWIILQIDRALIKGMRKGKQKFLPLLFRGLLAVSIGLFMAQPALVFLFDKEINLQISLDNEVRKKEKRNRQDSVYAAERSAVQMRKQVAETELKNRYAEVSKAREAFIQEADGTGGSKKPGLKTIAQAKQSAYQKLDQDYRQKAAELAPEIARADSALKAMEAHIQQEQQTFASLLNNGFITRIEALNHLIENSNAVAFRYYLLVAILLLIELMPVLAKLLLPTGTYELKVELQEEMEAITQRQAYEQDTEMTRHFFAEASAKRKSSIQQEIREWEPAAENPFSTLWEKVKRRLLTQKG